MFLPSITIFVFIMSILGGLAVVLWTLTWLCKLVIFPLKYIFNQITNMFNKVNY